MLPDVDSLALFVKAAELGSLTKAAEESNMSLAAASRRIALLEHRFKASLFDRSSRGIELTTAGAALVKHAKDLLVDINQMQSEMADYETGSKGVLRVMASTSVMTHRFPKDLAKFLKKYPDYRVVVQERWSDEVVKSLLSAQIDVGFIINGSVTNGLELYDYGTDRLCAVFQKGHPLGKVKNLRYSQILDYEIVGLEASANLMRLLAMEASKIDKVMRTRIEVRSFEAIQKAVSAGLGVGFLPFATEQPINLQDNNLIAVPIEEEWAKRRILLCVRKEKLNNTILQKFLEEFIQR
ncbi:LysR family transcriptional regulator [Polynucleobacter sinensis]|uniref:LysR family transcriptional regulator n=1 Tax=Polynucleobacter sinensis TaxID=1743157 RepID=UPI0007810205|nr:LysR family transcriptional regulator [Polynucleobacter sinensis]